VTAAEAEEEDTKENDAERKVSYEKVGCGNKLGCFYQ
jgi:hypothetical protein